MRKVPSNPLIPGYQIGVLPPQTTTSSTTSITRLLSSASPSKINYMVKQGSPNRSRGSATSNSQMKMCEVSATLQASSSKFTLGSWLRWQIWQSLTPRQVCHLRPQAGNYYSTCGFTCAAALKKTGPKLEGNAPSLKSYQSLSLSYHSSGTGQPFKLHGSHGHPQSIRGNTSIQTASTCVVRFLSLSSSSLQVLPYDFS